MWCSAHLIYFIGNDELGIFYDITWAVTFTNQLVLTTVSFSVFTLIQQEELTGWHPSWVKGTRIRVIVVNFCDFWMKGKEIYFELAENSSYPSSR